jgi:hypothetical protein
VDVSIRLKYLLQARHLQTHRNFCTAYDKIALSIDNALVQTWPSRAQLHRWLAGELKGLPYPDHCRVLEKMFTGWSASQLFEPVTADEGRVLAAGSLGEDPAVIDGYPHGQPDILLDLADVDNRAVAHRIRCARDIYFVAHTGYNAMVSQFRAVIQEAISRGCRLRLVVSNPHGPLMSQPEVTRRLCPSIRQIGEIEDVLDTCGRHRRLAESCGWPASNVQARVYDGPPNMSAFLIDGWLRIIPYMPLVDMTECPVFEYQFNPENAPKLVGKYLLSLDRIWADATEHPI